MSAGAKRTTPTDVTWRRYRQWCDGPEVSYTGTSAILQEAYAAGWTEAIDWQAGCLRRFWAKVSITANGCWEWTGMRIWNGYGHFWDGTRRDTGTPRLVLAHRWSYEHFAGPIPEGLDIDHLCRNRGCCNPCHLEPVTRSENVRRSPLMGAHARHMAARTHCAHGHAFDASNAAFTSDGRRRCRACDRVRAKRRREIAKGQSNG